MDAVKWMKRIKEGTALILKCVGIALAVAVFVFTVLGKMKTEEAVKIVSLSVACLGVGILAGTYQSNESERW